MSRASVAVLFPDGQIRYALYKGSCDHLLPRLFDEHRQAWEADDADSRADCWRLPDAIPPNSGEPVTIYCDYGAGSVWQGTATCYYVTSELDYVEIEDIQDCYFQQPEWVRWK